MKAPLGLAIGLNLIATAFCRDLLPERRLETLPASDSSLQQCYTFRTVPGVFYRVESTHDLTHWDSEEEIYGLGHEYTVAMREFIPPPVPEPGAPPATLPAPAKNVSLRIQRSSESEGGTVVSWISLDHGGPVIRLFSQSMVSGWDQLPLLWDRYGDYYFFLAHQMQSIPPPAENPSLGPKDAAMFADLETSFPAMNQAVEDSIARARNTPPPAPSDPNSRKFWRVHCDWSLDTDQDGSPDWAEFEMAALTTGGPVPPLRADAFNADTNGNGIPDGEELDHDNDGTADARDVDLDDDTATFETTPLPRYALFPITNAQPDPLYPHPFQINDQGTLLYSNGTWTGGLWTPLSGAANQSAVGVVVQAASINDHGEIIGHHTGMFDPSGNPVSSSKFVGNLVYWGSPGGTSGSLSVGDDHPWIGGIPLTYPGSPGIQFSNDGQLIGYNEKVSSVDEDGNNTTDLDGTFLWTLPGLGRTPGKTAVPFYEGGVLNADRYWGWPNETLPDASQRLQAGETELIPPGVIQNLHIGPTGELISMFKYNKDTWVYTAGAWWPSPLFAKAIDMSADGIAIGRAHNGLTAPILLNGKWSAIERAAPGPTPEWHDVSVTHLDTTPGGWILARRGPYVIPEQLEYAAMLPIRAECLYVQEFLAGVTTNKHVGVDNFSIGSIIPGPSVQDRIWIMAPLDGTPKNVNLTTPVNGIHPLVLSAPGIDFGNVEGKGYLYSRSSSVSLQADESATSGTDIPVDLHFDETASLSKPIGVKVMKARTVKVTLYKVTKETSGQPDNTADQTPDAMGLQQYLNDVFSPQINVKFQVSYATSPLTLNWDVNPDNLLDPEANNGELNCSAPEPSPEQNNILNTRPSNRPSSNIDVFLIGTAKYIDNLDWASTLRINGDGEQVNACWIVGDPLENREMSKLLQTIAHEIGHVFVGYGHPDIRAGGPSPLPGTRHPERLMVSGKGCQILRGHLLVKREWDEAEVWMRREEAENRMNP